MNISVSEIGTSKCLKSSTHERSPNVRGGSSISVVDYGERRSIKPEAKVGVRRLKARHRNRRQKYSV